MNDVLQRVSGESQPVPLWRTASTEDVDTAKEKEIPLLYSFRLNLKVIAACTRLLYLTHVSVEFLSHNDVSWVPFCCILTISPNFVSFSPCHCWIDFSHSNQQLSEIWFFGTRDTLLEAFFHLAFLCQGIQVTATTPSSTAVRLDTGEVSLEVSNSAPSSGLLPGQLRRSKYSVIFFYIWINLYTLEIYLYTRGRFLKRLWCCFGV